MSIQKGKTKKAKKAASINLPEIPEKLYFTIGEVGRLCSLQPHVLRYWEQEFLQLRPVKRRGNRRYYKKVDVELVRTIRDLLYCQGFTIEGARTQLAINRRQQSGQKREAQETKVQLKTVVSDLQQVLGELEDGQLEEA